MHRESRAFRPGASAFQHRTRAAGFLAQQFLFPHLERIPVFVGSPKTASLAEFRQWHGAWQPDAILCLLGEELEWMRRMEISPLEDTALVCLNRPAGSAFSGVEENNIRVGELACDVVVNHTTHNERGIPEHPKLVLVDGFWVDGDTLPSHKPSKHSKRKTRSPKKSASRYT